MFVVIDDGIHAVIRLRAEQDGTVAEFLIPTLVNGTRYPKAAKLTGFVTADALDEDQDAA